MGIAIDPGGFPWISYHDATNGGLKVAVLTTKDRAPAATITSPARNATVTGILTVQIDATDPEHTPGRLSVQVSIDQGTWATATYNAKTGLYELDWDATTTPDGSHTIQARATDSAGRTREATPTNVTVTNAAAQTVSVTSITYATEGGRDNDRHLVVTATLTDENDTPVDGASISARLERDNSVCETFSGTTDANGVVTFHARNAPAGSYTTTVTDVTAEGLTWDGTTPANGYQK